MNLDKKLKHLDFIQLVITRMGVNSFLIKGWAVTLVAAVFAFAAKDSNPKYVFIPMLTTIVFWVLDSYYLSLERQYRKLYDEVRQKDEKDIDFDLHAGRYNSHNNTWAASFFALSFVIFYMVLLSITIAIAITLTNG